jgi:hypothetical protein
VIRGAPAPGPAAFRIPLDFRQRCLFIGRGVNLSAEIAYLQQLKCAFEPLKALILAKNVLYMVKSDED